MHALRQSVNVVSENSGMAVISSNWDINVAVISSSLFFRDVNCSIMSFLSLRLFHDRFNPFSLVRPGVLS
jgi:hypothetical protein